MNFTPYGTPFTSVGSIPTGHQFTAAKLAHQVGTGGNQVLGLISADEAGVTYLRPVDVNGALTVNLPTNSGNSTTHNQIITLPISLPGAKPGDVQQQTLQIVVNPGPGGLTPGEKYHAVPLSLQHFQQGVLTVAYSNAQQGGESIQLQVHQAEAENGTVDHHTQTQQEQNSQHSSSGSTGTNNNNNNNHTDENSGPQPVAQIQHGIQTDEMVLPDVKPILTEAVATSDQGGTAQAYPVAVVAQLPSDLILRNEDLEQAEKNAGKDGKDRTREGENYNAISSWQSLAAPGTTVADYLSRIPASTLPLSLHHFLKFSAETIKRESAIESSPLSNADGTEGTQTAEMQTATGTDPENPDEVDPQSGKAKKKKKYKKKAPKPRRPRPGQVHIATALDGTTLFCCPECNMAYSAKDLLEQHLVSHKIERRFICDICGAGLKRKEHLERHKLGHNPERPYICSVCCKGFKRKEHLNLHFVIHSGEKTEVCPECGKGFYRKDHLRKHARSHLAKRVKEEFSQQQQAQQAAQQQQQAQQAAQQQQQAAQQHTTAEQGQQQPQTDVTEQDNGTTTTTVVLPTAAETGAMALLHHQHHHGERIGHHVIALENFNVEETTCEENT